MKELVQFIHRVYAAYLTGFENKQVLTEKYTLAIHLICFSWFFLILYLDVERLLFDQLISWCDIPQF